ncbi:DUF2357 domain-containing protein [uncultured Desulfosarcina sp.]|uniref:DUF2357 domain-containing protein n=1 Tax=uncultured Desulfosarcina sp. TaxID=218289 RepID=UPI0029C93BF3|nr:DUF2357 domain-containing protein [uncultured Desulfosarcina sp.]
MMNNRIYVSFHHWPWSVDVEDESASATDDGIELLYYGSPVVSVTAGTQVFLSTRYEKFVPLGPSFLDGTEVYETPHGVLSKKSRSQGEMMILSQGSRKKIAIEAKGAKHRTTRDGISESPMAVEVLRWSQFFDDLLDDKTIKATQSGKIPWIKVLRFLETQRSELQKPRLSLIVRIAEAMHYKLPKTVSGMRRILLRERSQQRISRICETDDRCLQWYVRQPGTNMAEKGGGRQELLAVVRRESFDVLENRVLKDFLFRCDLESKRYITNEVEINPNFVGSKRGKDVRRFREICTTSLKNRDFEAVPKAGAIVRPNYVLQNDLRYKEIWKWYCRLLRRAEEKDRFWDWQSRTWADIVRLLMNLSIVYLEGMGAPKRGVNIRRVLGSSLHVTREQVLGSRTRGGCEPGPFVVERCNNGKAQALAILEVVHPDEAYKHSIVKNLGRTGGHLYLVVRPLADSQVKSDVMIVWGVNSAGTNNQVPWEDVSGSATRALLFHRNVLAGARITNLPKLHGLVANSVLDSEGADVVCEESDAPIVVIPSDPLRWYDVVEYFAVLLSNWLEKRL